MDGLSTATLDHAHAGTPKASTGIDFVPVGVDHAGRRGRFKPHSITGEVKLTYAILATVDPFPMRAVDFRRW